VEDLLASHASIAEAAAFGVPDEEFGKRLRTFVVLRPGQRLSARAVKDFVRANLARSRVPRHVVFVDHLPRNPRGRS
jgi:fatty-acyl-CoA synthase